MTCFHLKIIIFTALKNLSILQRRVIVMYNAMLGLIQVKIYVEPSWEKGTVPLKIFLLQNRKFYDLET